jgi:hypothetical protein
MMMDSKSLLRRLLAVTAAEEELVLRFLLGKRTAEQGRASPDLDLFLAELEVEMPGAVELLGELRFALGDDLHGEVAHWAQGQAETNLLYRRVLTRFQTLFCAC